MTVTAVPIVPVGTIAMKNMKNILNFMIMITRVGVIRAQDKLKKLATKTQSPPPRKENAFVVVSSNKVSLSYKISLSNKIDISGALFTLQIYHYLRTFFVNQTSIDLVYLKQIKILYTLELQTTIQF